MQRPGVVRCTATLTSVGTSVVTGTFTPAPPVRGKLLFVDVSFSGPATQVAIARVRETVGGSIRLEYIGETAAFKDAPNGVPYAVSGPNQLKAQASTDDGSSASTVTITVDIEVN